MQEKEVGSKEEGVRAFGVFDYQRGRVDHPMPQVDRLLALACSRRKSGLGRPCRGTGFLVVVGAEAAVASKLTYQPQSVWICGSAGWMGGGNIEDESSNAKILFRRLAQKWTVALLAMAPTAGMNRMGAAFDTIDWKGRNMVKLLIVA